ncbi:hypothetical protein C8J56DRAFT_892768 [Mycena floridula]|nr:hypothetical protein C8J56DRAFT_892768 [Mycena floridula]
MLVLLKLTLSLLGCGSYGQVPPGMEVHENTGNLGQQVEKGVALFASALHDVRELIKEADALEREMDRAFSSGPEAKACMNLLHHTSDLDKDLMNAMTHCSHGLDNLRTVQTTSTTTRKNTQKYAKSAKSAKAPMDMSILQKSVDLTLLLQVEKAEKSSKKRKSGKSSGDIPVPKI